MRKERFDGKKPIEPALDEIFVRYHFAFTPYGTELYSVLIAQDALNVPTMTNGRRKEAEDDLDKRCLEVGVSRSQLGELRMQINALIKQKERELNDEK